MYSIRHLLFSLITLFIFIQCTNEADPNVKTVAYNSSTGDIDITLADVNREAEGAVLSRIELRERSLTGNVITFDISSNTAAWESSSYRLHNFSSTLKSGSTYYLIMQDGAFNNAGSSLGTADISSGESDGGVYQLYIP